ncbi:hypothetical protein ACLOJK_000672 [Asimina triloba]
MGPLLKPCFPNTRRGDKVLLHLTPIVAAQGRASLNTVVAAFQQDRASHITRCYRFSTRSCYPQYSLSSPLSKVMLPLTLVATAFRYGRASLSTPLLAHPNKPASKDVPPLALVTTTLQPTSEALSPLTHIVATLWSASKVISLDTYYYFSPACFRGHVSLDTYYYCSLAHS